MDHRSPGLPGFGVVCEDNSGPYEVSLDRFTNHVATVCHHHLQEPLHLGRSGDAAATLGVWHLRNKIIGFPVSGRVAAPTGLLGGSLHVQTCGVASAPSAPPVTRTHWASATELQRPKLGKDSHLLTDETARRTASKPRLRRGRFHGRRWWCPARQGSLRDSLRSCPRSALRAVP
jgi:hypothetical protein